MTKAEVLAWLKRDKLVPVVRAKSAEDAHRVTGALLEGGITIIELTMTVPGAVEVISALNARYGSQILLGAGTVTDAETARRCRDAGAQFIVSPAFDAETVAWCQQHDLVVAPGALTPTEVLTASRAGADVIKIFPCDAMGGATYLKSLRAPFPTIDLMPTGGVTLETLESFLAAGAVAVGVGSALVDPKVSEAELTERARSFVKAASPH